MKPSQVDQPGDGWSRWRGGQGGALQRAEVDADQARDVVAALLHVEDLYEGADELLRAHRSARHPLSEVERRRVAVDQCAVEVEERADVGALRSRCDGREEVVDVGHGSVLQSEGADDGDGGDSRSQLIGEVLARLEELVTPGAQERAVAGELERAAHEVLGDRLR